MKGDTGPTASAYLGSHKLKTQVAIGPPPPPVPFLSEVGAKKVAQAGKCLTATALGR